MKSRKKSLGKEKEKSQHKKERNSSILPKKEKEPFWKWQKLFVFDQTPSTILASAEDLEQAQILGASSLKMKVNASACCEQHSSSESGGSNEEKEECDTNGPRHWSIVDRDELNWQPANRVTCSFCQSQRVYFAETWLSEIRKK